MGRPTAVFNVFVNKCVAFNENSSTHSHESASLPERFFMETSLSSADERRARCQPLTKMSTSQWKNVKLSFSRTGLTISWLILGKDALFSLWH